MGSGALQLRGAAAAAGVPAPASGQSRQPVQRSAAQPVRAAGGPGEPSAHKRQGNNQTDLLTGGAADELGEGVDHEVGAVAQRRDDEGGEGGVHHQLEALQGAGARVGVVGRARVPTAPAVSYGSSSSR